MKVNFVAVYNIKGANSFAQGISASEFFNSGGMSGTLTDDATLALEHLYRAGAAARFILTAGSRSNGQSPDEVLAAAVLAGMTEHAKKFKNGLFLVLNVEREVANVNLSACATVGSYGIAADAIDNAEFRGEVDPLIEGVLTALVASLPSKVDTRVTKVGEYIFLQQDMPVYLMTMKLGFGQVSLSSPIEGDTLARAGAFATDLIADGRLKRTLHLHSIGAKTDTDPLLAFLAAWAALEVFANITYKDRYNDEWYSLLKGAAPIPAKGVISRLEDVMKDKLRLADKFSIIASILDPAGSDRDIAQFAEIKKFRDDFFHALEGSSGGFPTNAALGLLRKYLRLHIAHRKAN